MPAQTILNPSPFFIGLDSRPLTSGYVYIGQPDQDPREYPANVFLDEAMTQTANQPLRTNRGYVVRNGAPAALWFSDATAHSMMVIDSSGRQVLYVPRFYGAAPNFAAVPINTVDTFDGTGTSSAYTLSITPASEDETAVYVGGAYQQKSAYTLDGNQLTGNFTAGTDNVEVVTTSVANMDAVMSDISVFSQTASDAATSATSSETNAAASAAAAAQSADEAEQSANAAAVSEANAMAGAESSGNILFYDTKAAANTALAVLTNLQVVEVLADESKGGFRTRYRKESGSYAYKLVFKNNQFLFATVAALLADTSITYAAGVVSTGEVIRAERYAYTVAASGASDNHLTTAGGLKLYVTPDARGFVTPDQFGAPGGAVDETSYVQAALNSAFSVSLLRFYRVTSVKFPARAGMVLVGANANGCGLQGTSAGAAYVLATFDPTQTTVYGYHYIANFAVKGVGLRAVAVGQTVNTLMENINASTFTGTDGFVFEESFSNTFVNLTTGGLTTGVDFKVNATNLDTTWEMCYTNNAVVKYHLDINSGRREICLAQNAGFGQLTFRKFTAQGARRYGIAIRASLGSITFDDPYFENCISNMFIAGRDVNVINTLLDKTSATHMIWIDQTDSGTVQSVNFSNCYIGGTAKIIVGCATNVTFNGCKLSGDLTPYARIERASTNYVFAPYDGARTAVNVGVTREDKRSVIGMKVDGTAGQHALISVNAAGSLVVDAPFTFTDTAQTPLTVNCGFTGSSTPTYASGVAITPISVRGIGGTGALTYGAAGTIPPGLSVNSSTGQVTGTPTTPGTYIWGITATDSAGEVGRSRNMTATVT
jgi:hypothetical protein